VSAAERETPDRYVFIFTRVVENSPSITSSLIRNRRYVFTESAGIGYYFPAMGEFEEYYSGLSKKFRGNLRRAENQLKERTNLKTVILEGADATAALLASFIPIEASGWKGSTGSAIGESTELTDFYTTLTERLSSSGMLRWEFLYGDGQLIAANLSVRFGAIAVIWKLGYDEDFRKYSTGSLLFKYVLERAFADEGIEEFNLMSDTTWQTNWAPCHSNYFNLYLYPRSLISLLFGYLPRLAKENLRKHPVLLRLARALKWVMGKA
ncbi:MAG: GNAT family N-acetyltransferase, partial [Proteobacteria bacterium]|nr:GNAT family N-acetyltransferase [Pseudomonadota bacterium]